MNAINLCCWKKMKKEEFFNTIEFTNSWYNKNKLKKKYLPEIKIWALENNLPAPTEWYVDFKNEIIEKEKTFFGKVYDVKYYDIHLYLKFDRDLTEEEFKVFGTFCEGFLIGTKFSNRR